MNRADGGGTTQRSHATRVAASVSAPSTKRSQRDGVLIIEANHPESVVCKRSQQEGVLIIEANQPQSVACTAKYI